MKKLLIALVLAVVLSLTAACGHGEKAGTENNTQAFLTAFHKVEPKVQGTDRQLVMNAKNICGYVKTKDDWYTIAETGEFAGLQGGSNAVSLNIVDTSLKVYCPEVWNSIDK